jgi:hypothetical protein
MKHSVINFLKKIFSKEDNSAYSSKHTLNGMKTRKEHDFKVGEFIKKIRRDPKTKKVLNSELLDELHYENLMLDDLDDLEEYH